MKKILISLFLFVNTISFAQIDLGSVLEGGVVDAEKFLKGYLKPIPVGVGYGLSGGWYSTARAHKPFGFDVKVIANAALVPTKAETFTFNNSDYTNIKLDNKNLSSAELPTLFGSQELEDRPSLEFTSDDKSISVSTLPGSGIKESIGYNVVPSPMIQLGIGTFKKTDLKIRFIPKLTIAEFVEFSGFGLGIMHDLNQWLPKELPFDLSAIVAWNNLKVKAFLDTNDNPTQALEFNTSSFMFQVVASKKLLFLTVFAGLGSSSFNTNLSALGDYKVENIDKTYTDPIDLNYIEGSFKGNLGVNINLIILNLSADYAIQEYNTLTVTVGFSIR